MPLTMLRNTEKRYSRARRHIKDASTVHVRTPSTIDLMQKVATHGERIPNVSRCIGHPLNVRLAYKNIVGGKGFLISHFSSGVFVASSDAQRALENSIQWYERLLISVIIKNRHVRHKLVY